MYTFGILTSVYRNLFEEFDIRQEKIAVNFFFMPNDYEIEELTYTFIDEFF